MWANKIVDSLISVTVWVVLPLQLVTTLLLGCLAGVTLGLALLPFSLIWICLFLGPLLGLSWVWSKVPLLRVPAAVPGIPLAVLGNSYAAMMPSMGEMESRITKFLVCQTWPFSREFMAYMSGKAAPTSDLEEVLARLTSRDVAMRQLLASVPTVEHSSTDNEAAVGQDAFCPGCGARLKNNANFCEQCGLRV